LGGPEDLKCKSVSRKEEEEEGGSEKKMAVDTNFALLFEKLKVEDPWLPPRTWESIPSESGRRGSLSPSHFSSSSHPLYDASIVSVSPPKLSLSLNVLHNSSLCLESAKWCTWSLDFCCYRVGVFSGLWFVMGFYFSVFTELVFCCDV
jgi:hypothetical protein